MPQITTLFWDVGGVLLSNGWDRYARAEVPERFQLDEQEFNRRHYACIEDFETGHLSLDGYLAEVVFYQARPFSAGDFKDFMYAQSKPHPGTLALAKSLRDSDRFRMATLNNESLELNKYRIDHFELRSLFDLFLTSAFVGVRKPDPAIYELALQVTQTEPASALLIDDREGNLETARRLGLETIHHQGSAEQLKQALELKGVTT